MLEEDKEEWLITFVEEFAGKLCLRIFTSLRKELKSNYTYLLYTRVYKSIIT